MGKQLDIEILVEGKLGKVGDHTYGITRILKIGDKKVRLELKRNFYDFQSVAGASVWTDHGWAPIVDLAGQSSEISSLPKMLSGDGLPLAAQRQVEDILALLIDQAEKVLAW